MRLIAKLRENRRMLAAFRGKSSSISRSFFIIKEIQFQQD
jgi:hypothetical protein